MSDSMYNWNIVFEKARSIVEDNQDITKATLASSLGIPVSTFKDALKREWHINEVTEFLTTNKFNGLYRDKHLSLDTDGIIVIGDLEIPYQSDRVLARATMIAQKFGIRDIVFAGDFLCLDAVSFWPKGGGEQRMSLSDELLEGSNVLRRMAKWFNRAWFIEGNHERRIINMTKGDFDMESLFKLIAPDTMEVVTSNFDWCQINNDWLITHQAKYSSNPRAVALRLMHVHHKNVITFHQHHMSMSWDESGKYMLVDGGCCTVPQTRYYKTAKISTLPNWKTGFSVLRRDVNGDTKIHLFPEDETDWFFWENIKLK
jgi:hypothetical protein